MDPSLGTVSHWATKSIRNESETQEVHKIFTKTIGQSHKDQELNSETKM